MSKRTANIMTRCRVTDFCERFKIDIGIFDVKIERLLPRTVNQKIYNFYMPKNLYCVHWKKNGKDLLVNGVRGMEDNFKYVKFEMNEDKLNQRIRNIFPKHGTVNHLENVFVIDLETKNEQELAKAYAAGFFDVYLSQDRWDRDLIPEKIQSQRVSVNDFHISCGNPVMKMPKYFPENYEGDERTYIHNEGDGIFSWYMSLLLAHNASGFDS